MNPRTNVIFILVIIYCAPVFSSTLEKARTENENRQVNFAERVVMSELTRALSHSVRQFQENCLSACVDNGALELAIGLIGLSNGDSGTAALINLLGLRLDGAGSEERTCQMLNRGRDISGSLEHMNAAGVVIHCHNMFIDLPKKKYWRCA